MFVAGHTAPVHVRFYTDRDTQQPHIYGHGVTEAEVLDVLRRPIENRAGSQDSRVLIGRSSAGRFLRVIVVFDSDGEGVFVITAFPLAGKPLAALRRRMRRRGSK